MITRGGFGTEGRDRGHEIHLNIWPEIKQIEIYTSRGQSYIAKGDQAVKFAEWMRDNLCEPLLGLARPDKSKELQDVETTKGI